VKQEQDNYCYLFTFFSLWNEATYWRRLHWKHFITTLFI